MTQRVSLPSVATTVTPGYPWQLDLDMLFDNVRPGDWPDWIVRMHIWSNDMRLTLTNGSGVAFDSTDGLPGATGPHIIPVIRLSDIQTRSFADQANINYVIDLKPPGGVAEDYFAGVIQRTSGPPLDMLT